MGGRCRNRGSDLAFAARPGWKHSVTLKISVGSVFVLSDMASSRKAQADWTSIRRGRNKLSAFAGTLGFSRLSFV